MGLAASQARLLTLTSRLSSIELKQQSIANAKILLANDSEAVSSKYTTALNNQTLLFSDGKNETELSYENLAAAGYTVRRTGDGVVANSAKRVIQPPTVPKPESLKAPALEDFVDKTKPTLAKDVTSWTEKVGALSKTYGEYPATTKTTNLQQLLQNTSAVSVSYSDWERNYSKKNNTVDDYWSINNQINASNLWNLINRKEDTVIKIADDGDKKGVPVEQAQKNVQAVGNAIINSLAKAFGFTDNTQFKASLQPFLDDLKKNINGYQDKNKHHSERKARNGAKDDARKTIIGNGTDKTGTDQDFYYLNVSELARRLVAKAMNIYAGQNVSIGTKCDSAKVNLSTSTNYNFKYNSRGYSVSEYEKKMQAEFTAQKYTKLNWSNGLEIVKGNKVDTSKDTGIDPSEQKAYEKSKSDYEKQYNDSLTQWNNYEKEVEALAKEGKTPAQALAEQLKSSSKFLIQGLLSGYLTLMKDGKDVSLSSSTDILTKYDKSDDAQAEAEYEAEMKKINRKEKLLDNQMKQLDTEHSAMQQEINSVKSIIQRHAEKDFSLFA